MESPETINPVLCAEYVQERLHAVPTSELREVQL
jgi:hypothetical protein